MDAIFDETAPKKATNLSVNRDLLEKARELKINLSHLLEDRLAVAVREEGRRRWLEENAEAIGEYNRRDGNSIVMPSSGKEN